MPGLGPPQLNTDVARMSCLKGIKLPTAEEEGEETTAGCSLVGLIGFVGMQEADETGSMAAAPGHKVWHANGITEGLSKACRAPVAHGRGAGSSGCKKLHFGMCWTTLPGATKVSPPPSTRV